MADPLENPLHSCRGLPQLPGRKRAWAFQPEKLRHRDPCIHQPVAQTPFPKHVDLETSSNSTATSCVGHLANPRAGFCYSYFVDEGPEVQRRKETCPTLIERGSGKMMFRPRRGRASGARSLASHGHHRPSSLTRHSAHLGAQSTCKRDPEADPTPLQSQLPPL